MSETIEDVRNCTTKQIIGMSTGVTDMVDNRMRRIEMQMIRSQSAALGSGFLRSDDGVDDLAILTKNFESLRQAFNDMVDAIELVASGAKMVHHDEEELAI